MKSLNLIRNSLYVLFGGFLLCIPFGVDEGMVNGLITGKMYWLCVTGLLLFIPFLILEIIERNSTLRLGIPDLMAALLLITVLITYDWKLNPDLTTLIFMVQILLIWFLFRQMCSKEPLLAFCFVPVILITGALQAIWGLIQIYNLADSNHSLFRLTGFFPNPGPYSGYLAFILPIAVGYLFHVRKVKNSFNHDFRVIYYISGITALLIIMVLPSGMSRSAWLAAIISTGWVLWKYRFGKRKYTIYIRRKPKMIIAITGAAILLLVGTLSALYYLKKDSADGRFLMWKVTTQTFLKSPVTGTGVGGFPAAFAETQAEYMVSGRATEQEKLVAGCPEYAFNEYLQIITELGVFGFLFFMVAIGSVIYISYRKKRYYVVGGLVSFLIFSFSSYPLRDPSFLPALVILSVIGITDTRIRERRYQSYLPYVMILLTVVFLGITFYQIKRLNSYRNWMEARVLYTNNAFRAAIDKYAPLYPDLCYDQGYLFEYAQCLGKSERYEEAIQYLQRASRISSDPMIHYMIGKNNMLCGRYEEAEAIYQHAIHILPERIYPYYLMTELYSHPENYQEHKLQAAADSVLYKKPKVETQAIFEMREKVNKLLKNRNEQKSSN